MKKIILGLSFVVMAMIAASQVTRPTPHSTVDLFRQSDDRDISSSGNTANTLMKTGDLGNPPLHNWIKQFGGDAADVGQDVITDASGNSYVTGFFSGPVNFGTETFTSVGYTDGFLAKFNNTGTMIWFRQLSCEPYTIVRSNAITSDHLGNIYITGSFTGNILQIGSYSLERVGTEDLFVAKYDTSGMPVMAMHNNNGGIMQGMSIAVDAENSCFVISGIANTYFSGNYFSKYDQNGYLLWDFYNGANFRDIKFNNSQDLYITGFIDSEVTFGNTTLTPGGYGTAPFLVKCNTAGSFAWAIQGVPIQDFGYESINGASSVAIDGDENIYFSGRFREKLAFGGDTLTNEHRPDYAPYLVKCTSSGSFEWARQGFVSYSIYVLNSVSSPVEITVDHDGNSLITFDLLNDIINFGSYSVEGDGGCIVKYDANGNARWAYNVAGSMKGLCGIAGNKFLAAGTIGGNVVVSQADSSDVEEWRAVSAGNSGTAQVVNLASDSYGNIFMYGKTDIPDPLTGSITGAFLAKINPDGDTLWSLPLNGGDFNTTYGSFVSVDREDNVCIMGNFTDTLRIGNKMLTSYGYTNTLFIAKINSSGNPLWLKKIGDGLMTTLDGYSLTTDNQNNVIVCGIFYGQLRVGTYTLDDAGNGDAFIVKFDGNGNVSWAQRAGGADLEWSGYVSADESNNIYLTGEFYSRTITVGSQTVQLTNNDGDVALIKLTPEGQMSWLRAFGGGATDTLRRYYCWPTAIKNDADGNSYIYGWTSKSNWYGPYLLESPYNYNFSLLKVNTSGTVQWAKIIKEKRLGWHSMQIDIDGQGNCYIGGNIKDTIYFENTPVVKQGYSDLFLAKYGNTGNFIWAKLFSSNPLENNGIPSTTNYLNGIAVYDTASLFIAGNSTYDLAVDDIILHSSNTNGFISLIGPDIPVGLKPLEKAETGLTLYPNPAGDYLEISYIGSVNPGKAETSVEIINPGGQILSRHQFSSASNQISVGVQDLPTGMYFVRLKTGNEIKTGKFIKQ